MVHMAVMVNMEKMVRKEKMVKMVGTGAMAVMAEMIFNSDHYFTTEIDNHRGESLCGCLSLW